MIPGEEQHLVYTEMNKQLIVRKIYRRLKNVDGESGRRELMEKAVAYGEDLFRKDTSLMSVIKILKNTKMAVL